MAGKRMINFATGLLFTGIFCLNSGAFGYVSSGEACPASEVVFIDPSVQEAEMIVSQLPKGVEVVRLTPWIDGIDQISEHLTKKADLSAIHILSHGAAGYFILNGKRIDSDFLRNYGNVITSWGRSLVENGDILLYACNLAATDEGKAFVGKFADLSGTDVATSIDNTGSNVYDGDWELEHVTGSIEANKLAIDNSYEYMLTTRFVTNANDSGQGSLRDRISEAAIIGDHIVFNNSYNIRLDSEIEIDKDISISGGEHTIVIYSSEGILPIRITGTSDVTFRTVTLEGDGQGGAAINHGSSGLLTLENVILKDSVDANVGSGGVTVTGSLILSGNVTIDTDGTTDADINITGTIDGATANSQSLTLNSGTGGTISVSGAIGDSTKLAQLVLTNSNDATFTGNVTAGTSITLTDTSAGQTISFGGSLETPTLTTAAQAYNVELLGGCTITNDTSFQNTGTTTIGNGASDTSTFTNGLDALAGPVTIAGTVATTETAINLGTTTVSDSSTINSLGGAITLGTSTFNEDLTVNSAGGDVTFGAVTINNGKTLTVGTGDTGAISFGSTIKSAAEATGNLNINTDNLANFSEPVGENAPIGILTLTAGTVSAGGSSITAGTIAVNGGTFGQATSPTGNWDVDNVTIASGATMNATTGDFNVSGNWSNSGTFNHKTGTVTLDGGSQSISGSTTFYNLKKNIETAATLTFQNGTANRTIVKNTLQLQGGSEALLSLRSSSTDSQWEIDPQGTRNILNLDVKDSNNVGATNINAVGQNCTDSGNNTKWSFTELTSGTYYLDTAGNDSNAGTAAAPWKTFHYAIDRINNGATGTSAITYTLIMGTGTYNITDNGEDDTAINLSQSYVTIIGAGDAAIGGNPTAVIDGADADDWTKAFRITGSNVIIKGVSITNFSGTGKIGIEIFGGGGTTGNEVGNCKIFNNQRGIEITDSSAFKVRDCEIYSNIDDGLYVETSTDGEIYSNTIYKQQAAGNNGINVVNCSPSIKRNKIYDNDGLNRSAAA